ncbi:MAG: hypothetical protein ABSB91_03640 [Sedimentisphaerales bacterium]
MKRQIIALAGLALLALLTGCPGNSKPVIHDDKSDPVTTILKKNKYTPIVPISDGYCLGDIYRGSLSNLIRVLQIDKDLPEVYSQTFESIRPSNVSLPVVSGNETFELNAKADIIGIIQGQLKTSGVMRFRVNIEDPCDYSISEAAFRKNIYSAIVTQYPDNNYVGMYVVASLLKVKRIEYELTNERDVNVNILSKGATKYVANAGLGVAGDANGHYILCSSAPSYIGFKLYTINAKYGFEPLATRELGSILRTKSSEAMQAKKAKIEGLNKEQVALLESKQTKEAKIKELDEREPKSLASVQADETKVENLRKAQASPSKSMTAEVKTEALSRAEAKLSESKAKIDELSKEKAELWKSAMADEANIKALGTEKAELSQSIKADETGMEESQRKARAELAGSIVLEEVPVEELRKVGAKLNK